MPITIDNYRFGNVNIQSPVLCAGAISSEISAQPRALAIEGESNFPDVCLRRRLQVLLVVREKICEGV